MEISVQHAIKLTSDEEMIRDKEWEKFDRTVYGRRYDDYQWQYEKYIKAVSEREFVGFLQATGEAGVLWIEELLVFEAYRGQGVGQALMDELHAYAKELKIHKIILETHPKIDAVKFYEKNGFKIEATLPNHYAHDNSILMSKFLE